MLLGLMQDSDRGEGAQDASIQISFMLFVRGKGNRWQPLIHIDAFCHGGIQQNLLRHLSWFSVWTLNSDTNLLVFLWLCFPLCDYYNIIILSESKAGFPFTSTFSILKQENQNKPRWTFEVDPGKTALWGQVVVGRKSRGKWVKVGQPGEPSGAGWFKLHR